jgi:ABC-2 type transport system permease protein
MNRMLLLIRREFWEHRAFLIAPAVVAATCIIILIFASGELWFRNIPLDALIEEQFQGRTTPIVGLILVGFGSFFFLVSMVVGFFYLLDCLHSDRKDRSVLFWKSMPLSDAATTLSKLTTAAVALPVVALGAAIVGNILFALVYTTRLGFDTTTNLWPIVFDGAAWLGALVLLAWGAIAAVLWYLPIMGWLLLVSSWAKRAVMLWAVLPFVMAIILESLFRSSYVASTLWYRIVGWLDPAYRDLSSIPSFIEVHGEKVPWPSSALELVSAGEYFSNLDLWLGIAVAVAFVWGAVLVRRHRTEI